MCLQRLPWSSPHSLGGECGQDLLCEALDLPELVDRSEPADEVVDAAVGELAQPRADLLRSADGTPVREVHRLRQLRVVLRDVVVERGTGLVLGLTDVHRDLVRDDVAVEVLLVALRGVTQIANLLRQFLRMLRTTARHPAVSVLNHAAAGTLHAPAHLVTGRVAHEARVRDDPDRGRLLQRPEWRHLRSRTERDAVVVEVLAVERDLPLRPQRPQYVETLFPDRSGLRVVEAEGGKLAANALLRVALAGAEDGAAAGEHVEGRPLQREVQRVARRRDEASGAQADTRGSLRDRGEQGKRLIARLREEAVADPDRVEAGVLDDGREVEQGLEGVVGGDERLPVVEVDAELKRLVAHSVTFLSKEASASSNSSALIDCSRACGTLMCSAISTAAFSASPSRAARRIARCSETERRRSPRRTRERLQ